MGGPQDDSHTSASSGAACVVQCQATAQCGGVTFQSGVAPVFCYLRRHIWIDHCEASTEYDTIIVYSPPPPPYAPIPPWWPPSHCSELCASNPIPATLLPQLSASNLEQQAAWHAYLTRVYHEPIGNRTVDTKRFSWFYLEKKAELIDSPPCTTVCQLSLSDGPTFEGTPWIGTKGPEGPHAVGAYGFFVRRPFPSVAEARDCRTIEVFHAAARWTGAEMGISWFYQTVGSGIFLDCDELRKRGSIVAVRTRSVSPHPSEGNLADWMANAGVAMLIYTAEDFEWMLGGGVSVPRTELIVRHANVGHSEYDNARGACLDDPAIAIPLRTGFDGNLPCRCVPQSDLRERPFWAGSGYSDEPGIVDAVNCAGNA